VNADPVEFSVVQRRAADSLGGNNNNIHNRFEVIDWLPVLASMVSSPTTVKDVVVYHDGAGLSHLPDFELITKDKGEDGKTAEVELGGSGSGVVLKITDVKVEADDCVVEEVEKRGGAKESSSSSGSGSGSSSGSSSSDSGGDGGKNVVNIATMIAELETDENPYFYVVRRIKGGSKTEKKLFSKLNLRRPSEGACCLVALSPGLLRWSLSVAKRMKHNRIDQLVEIRRATLADVKVAVATDDVLLADRVAARGGMVLNAKQLEELIA